MKYYGVGLVGHGRCGRVGVIPIRFPDGIVSFEIGEGKGYAVGLRKVAEGVVRDSGFSAHWHHAQTSSIKSCSLV